jgi:hypothetical protein
MYERGVFHVYYVVLLHNRKSAATVFWSSLCKSLLTRYKCSRSVTLPDLHLIPKGSDNGIGITRAFFLGVRGDKLYHHLFQTYKNKIVFICFTST